MRELTSIADALGRAANAGEPAMLATVVHTEGSTYRKPGARMLVRADGSTVGTVSGGCLDADLLARWADLTAGGRPACVTYDLRGAGGADDDLVWGLGLGCDGLVEVLLEPVAPADAASLAALFAACAAVDHSATLVTRLEGPAAGTRVLVRDGAVIGRWHRPDAPDLAPLVAAAAEADASAGLAAGLAVERLTPAVRLLVCGAGVDAVPLVRLATGLGWRVTVTDDRPAYAHADYFPGADVRVLPPEALGTAALPVPRGAAAVVMSHSYERDFAYLGALAGVCTDAAAPVDSDAAGTLAYVGPLGPRRRTQRMLAELAEAGRPAPDAFQALVHAPAGLDVGGEGPEAIALSIVAEVAAVAHGRAGGMLRDRPARGDAPGGQMLRAAGTLGDGRRLTAA